MSRQSAMAAPAVASLSVNDAEAVAHVVSVADGSMWVTFLSQKWSQIALIWDVWHMLSQSSASRIGEVCFLFVDLQYVCYVV